MALPTTWTSLTAASTDPICRYFRPSAAPTSRPRPRRASVIRDAFALGSYEEADAVSLVSAVQQQQQQQQQQQLQERPASSSLQLLTSVHAIRSRASGFVRTLASRIGQLPQYQTLSSVTTAAVATVRGNAPARTPAIPMQPASHSTSPHPTTAIDPVQGQPLLQRFLDRADRLEVLYASLLSDLCNMAYEAEKVDDAMLQRHQLQLVSSSAQPLFGPITRDTYEQQLESAKAAKAAKAPGAQGPHPRHQAAHLQLQPLNAAATSTAVSPSHPGLQNPGTLLHLASSSMDVMDMAQELGLASASGSGYQGCPDVEYSMLMTSSMECLLDSIDEASASLPFDYRMDSMASCDDFHPGASLDQDPSTQKLPRKLSSFRPSSLATEPAKSAAAAVMAGDADRPHSPQAANLIEQPAPPAAWFVADDPVTKVRYFIIQGSTSFDHWTINFNFEPVLFEDPALGARIHRGVYEAALRLYDDLVPLVRQHLASSPSATLCFGGHSLGGSLATALLLLLVHRKVVRPSALSPSYTFGAPAVFCAGSGAVGSGSAATAPAAGAAAAAAAGSGGHACDACQLSCEPEVRAAERRRDARSCGRRKPLMEQLGLPELLVTNVMMHKDIVPRAFACDYTVVADLLKQWMPSFKDHSQLSSSQQHKSLYNFLGGVAVLRPDDNAPFVVNDNAHPMLPNVSGLYRLRDVRHIDHVSGSFDSLAAPADTACHHHHNRAVSPSSAPTSTAPVPPTLRSAFLQFMNHPHPLQSLSLYESYGPSGSISRYHNPDNYTKGLTGLLEEQAPKPSSRPAAAVAKQPQHKLSAEPLPSPSPSPPAAQGRKVAVMAAPFLATVGLLSVAVIGL